MRLVSYRVSSRGLTTPDGLDSWQQSGQHFRTAIQDSSSGQQDASIRNGKSRSGGQRPPKHQSTMKVNQWITLMKCSVLLHVVSDELVLTRIIIRVRGPISASSVTICSLIFFICTFCRWPGQVVQIDVTKTCGAQNRDQYFCLILWTNMFRHTLSTNFHALLQFVN